jgi:uncharacterized protein with ATP-grasp and redox domains
MTYKLMYILWKGASEFELLSDAKERNIFDLLEASLF